MYTLYKVNLLDTELRLSDYSESDGSFYIATTTVHLLTFITWDMVQKKSSWRQQIVPKDETNGA